MKPTNYHLFDFLDFDTELSRNESLWKAYKPTAVYEKEGDIYVTVPFQKQKLANDMMADTDVPQEEYTLIIRQYNIGITRLFLGFGDYVLTDESEMLQFSERIRRVPLSVDSESTPVYKRTKRKMDSFDGRRNEACRYQCGRASIRPMERIASRPSRNA